MTAPAHPSRARLGLCGGSSCSSRCVALLAPAALATGTPALRAVTTQPLAVQGIRFRPSERVTVRVVVSGKARVHVVTRDQGGHVHDHLHGRLARALHPLRDRRQREPRKHRHASPHLPGLLAAANPTRPPAAAEAGSHSNAGRAQIRQACRRQRCGWASEHDPLYLAYHDEEWGVPSHDDRQLFEILVLEGAQAGLSWSRSSTSARTTARAFAGFDPAKVARFGAARRRAAARRRRASSATG